MKLRLERTTQFPSCIIGKLYIDGVFECFTLEDLERTHKLEGETAIPCRTYQVVIDQSQRFGRIMPHLLEVPGFSGIRIHSGNTDKDTEGCILVGLHAGPGYLEKSHLAFDSLFTKLEQSKEDISIQIVDAF